MLVLIVGLSEFVDELDDLLGLVLDFGFAILEDCSQLG